MVIRLVSTGLLRLVSTGVLAATLMLKSNDVAGGVVSCPWGNVQRCYDWLSPAYYDR